MAEQFPRGLLADPAMQRAMLLPVARRTFTDPGDDITEELGGLEFAAPGLLYDPMMGMAQTGAMLMGDMPVNPNVMTQTMLDAPLIGGLLGAATGAVPEGAVLGAFSGRGKGSGAAHARPLNPTNRSLKGINDSPDDNQPPKENFSAVENIYNLYFYNQNIPPKTAEKIKAVIQKHTATNDINTAERAMLGPALDEIQSLQSAAKSKAKKPRWPSKIDLTTIDGVASALKQKLGGGVISGKPYNSRYFDVGENSRLRISDHLAATRRSANNSGEVIVSYGSKGINFDVGDDSLTIPYNDKRLSNRDGLQELIDLIQGSDSIELGANKAPTAALPGLLDDTASRMQRARDMGFDVDNPVYHGTSAEFSKFKDTGINWFTTSKEDAEDYVPDRIFEGFLKTTKLADFDAPEVKNLLLKKGHDVNDLFQITEDGEAVKKILKNEGYDGIVVEREDLGATHYAVFDPKDIRSRFAKFDPAKADSADLLAANPATAALPGLLQDRSGNIDQRSLLSRTPRRRTSFPMRGLLGQRLYTATTPDGAI